MRSYSELILIPTFEERFKYLKIGGVIGQATFGHDRYLNQKFYTSAEWRRFRDKIIVRDDGCDMAHPDHYIFGRHTIHHLNPLLPRSFEEEIERLMDEENVVLVSLDTHNAIHYGDIDLLPQQMVTRSPHDTSPWRR
jgi:hypothetical protein